MNEVPGYIIRSYFICKRETWFQLHSIELVQDHPLLIMGRLTTSQSFPRRIHEIIFDNITLDMVRKEGHEIIVSEIKKSSHAEHASEMQLLYYLYRLKQEGLLARGELLYPEEKGKKIVKLSSEMEHMLLDILQEINKIQEMSVPPPYVKNNYCSSCSYLELCTA